MPTTIPCQAILAGKCIQLTYSDYIRVVEVHAAGYTKDENAVIRVWQVRGGSVSNEPVGWKLMRLDEAESMHIIDEDSQAPRQGYKRDDKHIPRIMGQI